MDERYIHTKAGLTIFTESIGKINKPPIVLIMGAMNQGIFWYDSFCQKLSDNEFYVIRFDHRDTGLSSMVDYKKSPYDLNDLTDDVIAILDFYNINKAHILGLSMGGYIGQLLGVNYPKRIETLTLISTTADHRPYMDATMGNFNNKYILPYPKKIFLDYIEKGKAEPPKNESDIYNFQIEGWRIMFGNINTEDFKAITHLIELANNRSNNRYSAYNHGLAVSNSKERINIVKNIVAPTLIIHGENDPCLPLEHGKFLNELIPNSKFEIIKDMGHMFSLTESKYLSDIIIKNIIDLQFA